MKRNIVKIDKEKCNGCGLCVNACHEGALQIIDGKAELVSESYCDGLGNCLPQCPTGAIEIEERETSAFDEEAVKKHMEHTAKANNAGHPVNHVIQSTELPYVANQAQGHTEKLACGCPGTHARSIERKTSIQHSNNGMDYRGAQIAAQDIKGMQSAESQLRQWPCQIKLVPVNAPYFNNAHLLVAADCTAYAYANFHQDFMKNKITIIGCPKLDEPNYADKISEILKRNEIKSITVLRMEVPCCGGIVHAVKTALLNSGKMIPWSVVTISTDGELIMD